MSTPKTWIGERLAILQDMAGKYSAALIADKINELTGANISRNAVIGAMDRMNCPGRPRVKSAPKPRAARIRPTIIKARPVKPTPQPIQSLSIPFLEGMQGQCRYITSPLDAHALICGHPVETGSFCEWHRSVVIERPGSRVVSSFRKRRNSYATIQGRLGFSAHG